MQIHLTLSEPLKRFESCDVYFWNIFESVITLKIRNYKCTQSKEKSDRVNQNDKNYRAGEEITAV